LVAALNLSARTLALTMSKFPAAGRILFDIYYKRRFF